MTELGLPPHVLERAMKRQRELHEERIRTMYNRHRALFAESLVAELLDGAREMLDPSAAWDVTWALDDKPIKVQVKCSGGYLPRHPDPTRVAAASWTIEVPKKGWDPDGDTGSLWNLGNGHHCDVFVLARHVGRDLGQGWMFAAVSKWLVVDARTKQGNPKTKFTAGHLDQLGVSLVEPSSLANAVRAAVLSSGSSRGGTA